MTLLDQLKRDEGRRPRPYKDSKEIWTVGYGHNLTTGALTEAAMTQILTDDMHAAETACLILPFWFSLSPPRKDALINLTVNQGIGWVGKNPRVVAALSAGDYPAAAHALLGGPYEQQVGARARRIAQQIETDQWV